MKKIHPDDLTLLNDYAGDNLSVNLIYSQANHPNNHFGQLYHPRASKLWLHHELAQIIVMAAHIAHDQFGWQLELIDGLRPYEAQEKMQAAGYPPHIVSKPGSGGHSRAMAIDIWPRDADGHYVDMGTPFDFLIHDPDQDNPAGRHYALFTPSSKTDTAQDMAQNVKIWQNRSRLDFAIFAAAHHYNREIEAWPYEWWDYRFPKSYWSQFDYLSEANDLRPDQFLVGLDDANA